MHRRVLLCSVSGFATLRETAGDSGERAGQARSISEGSPPPSRIAPRAADMEGAENHRRPERSG